VAFADAHIASPGRSAHDRGLLLWLPLVVGLLLVVFPFAFWVGG
jgi:hypothetical protein